jgi:uncharacterized protein YaaR (DUF327 family)
MLHETDDGISAPAADIPADYHVAGAGDVEAVLDRIFEIGERLKDRPTRQNVFEYRNAVKALLQHVLSEGLTVEERESSPNVLRQKRFTLIRVIDDRLERLASSVLVSQRDTLDVLARVDELNGLIVNLIR